MTRIIQNSLVTLCLLLCTGIHAQSFKSRAALGSVNKTGFYSIVVTPELSSYIKTDFSDVRVVDGDGKHAEYVVKMGGFTFRFDTIAFKPLSIIKNSLDDSGRTIVIIENSAKDKINSIALIIGNASVSRIANISGSDDNKKWFSVAENLMLQRKYINDTDKFAEKILFPLVSYRYIRITIYNGKNDPLNIISAGKYLDPEDYQYKSMIPKLENPTCRFFQTDSSNGYSYIKVHDSLPFQIDKVAVSVTGPKFFKRDAEITVPYATDANFTLLSNTVFNLDVPAFKSKDWLIKIYNGDNPPLKIIGISTYQQEKNIIALLDSGKTYHLEMNNPSAVAPAYDLQNFKDSIPKNVIPLQYSAIENTAVASVSPNTSVFKQSWLWAVIVLVLAVLVYFTWQLTKEVAKK